VLNGGLGFCDVCSSQVFVEYNLNKDHMHRLMQRQVLLHLNKKLEKAFALFFAMSNKYVDEGRDNSYHSWQK
jgi:hypothetical protein